MEEFLDEKFQAVIDVWGMLNPLKVIEYDGVECIDYKRLKQIYM